jgi:hypothetical protein
VVVDSISECGATVANRPVGRTGKWAEPAYSAETYPAFGCGAGDMFWRMLSILRTYERSVRTGKNDIEVFIERNSMRCTLTILAAAH